MKPPFRQGDMDSLCGVYAVVNASRMLNNSPKEESEALFNRIVAYLSQKRMLKKAVINGLGPREMLDLLRYASLLVSTPWMGVTTPSLNEFWKSLEDWDGVVVIDFDGVHDHYSVVKKITGRSIHLYDSSGISRLPRSLCTTGNRGRHRLRPAQSFFVQRYNAAER